MAALPPWAASYVGLPYRDRGRARDGLDCWGLLCLVYAERCGIVLPAFDGLGWHDFAAAAADRAGAAALARFMANHMEGWAPIPAMPRERASWPALRECDAIHLTTMGEPVHCGVVLAPPWFLHIEEGIDSCIEDWTAIRFRNRVAGFYRWQGSPPHSVR